MSSEAQTRLPWTAEEDTILIDLVQKYGEKRWNMVANGLPGRTGKGCSHRWRTYLRPDVKHPHLEPFTEWEAAVIVQAQRDMGNNWLAIAKLLLPGRSNTAVKNFWHCRLKSGSGTHTNRFIVENYNLRYLLNEVPEDDRLHPVALPAFPSTAPTGHVRRQIHPRPRQEAAAQAAAAAEAALMMQQITSQAQAMGMDPQTYMQQAGMMDPAYASMYGSYEQMGMSQAGYGTMPPSSFSSKEELKQHASTYVQQQLAMMANGGGSSSMAYSGSGWADGSTAGTAGAGPKKSGRGRGRPPGSKNRNNNTDAAADAAAAAAAAAEATAAEQQHYHQQQQQQQYSMTARTSQDEAATWCSTGMMLAGSTAAGAPQGSPGGEAHSSATYMTARHMPSSSTAAAAAAAGPGAEPLDPAALAAAPIPLACGGPSDAATAAGAHAAAGADGTAAGPECCGLLGTSAAAAAELNRIPVMPGFRVSMSGLDFELEAAGGGGSCVRFSSRSLKLLEYEDGGACMPGYKPSYSSMDFRNSLTSFDEILGHNAAHRMSGHTHMAMRGPSSWDGAGSSPRSQPSDATAVAAAAGTLAAPGVAAAATTAAAASAAAAGYAHGSSEADNALTAAFKQQQQQQQQAAPQQGLAAPSGSSSMLHGSAWVAAQQPPNSAAAAAAAAAVPAGLGSSLSGVHSGSFTFPAVTAAQEDIHPGAIAGPTAGGAGAAGSEATPFSAAPLQAAPFSPAGAAAVTSAVLAASQAADVQSAGVAQLTEQGPASQPMGPPAAITAAGTDTGSVPPVAPRMPPAFHSVLQALQPPAASLMGGNSSSASAAAAAAGLPVGSGGMQLVKLEHHQHVQQPLGRDSALAAASPAITGLSAAAVGSACALSSMATSQVSGFMLPAAAAAGHHHHHLGGRQQQQQMPMPMPLPPQLLLPPQHQQLPGHRVSDLHMGPLPSPIDLFHGDHGLHHDDLLIGTEDVFDERMLCTGSNAQQQQQQQHTQQHPEQHQHQQYQHQPAQQVVYAGMSALQLVNQSFGRSCSSAATGGHGQLQQAGTSAAAVAARPAGPHPAAQAQRASTNPCGAGGAGGQHSSVMHPAHTPGPAAAGHQEQPDATSKQGVKRSRSSANGSTWAKKQRQSEGSLVEVCTASHGMDDCLLWHHD